MANPPPNQSSTKEGQSVYRDWPDGKTHTISWAQHKENMKAESGNRSTATPGAGSIDTKNPGTFTPGTPGVPTPPVKPFLTGDQMGADAQKRGAWRQSIIDIDQAIQDLETQTGLEQKNLEKSRVQSRDNVGNSTATAGWVGSSVQDGDLFDIEATARLRREYMTTNLDNAKITAGNKKSAITDEQDAWDKALEQMKVENAAGVAQSQGPWLTEPTAGSWKPAGPGDQAISGYAPPNQSSTREGSTATPRPPNQSSTREGSTASLTTRKSSGGRGTSTKRGGATPYGP